MRSVAESLTSGNKPQRKIRKNVVTNLASLLSVKLVYAARAKRCSAEAHKGKRQMRHLIALMAARRQVDKLILISKFICYNKFIMKYTIQDLSLNIPVNSREFKNMVKYFAESDIPNAYFVAPISDNPCTAPVLDGVLPAEHGKKYWDGFAAVLVARGLPKINDVKADILHWVEDINWPGSDAVIIFVNQNFSAFLPEIFATLEEAYDKKDIGWFENLLGCFFEESPYVQEILEYLEDDCWKEFDIKYGIDNVLQRVKSDFEEAQK